MGPRRSLCKPSLSEPGKPACDAATPDAGGWLTSCAHLVSNAGAAVRIGWQYFRTDVIGPENWRSFEFPTEEYNSCPEPLLKLPTENSPAKAGLFVKKLSQFTTPRPAYGCGRCGLIPTWRTQQRPCLARPGGQPYPRQPTLRPLLQPKARRPPLPQPCPPPWPPLISRTSDAKAELGILAGAVPGRADACVANPIGKAMRSPNNNFFIFVIPLFPCQLTAMVRQSSTFACSASRIQ